MQKQTFLNTFSKKARWVMFGAADVTLTLLLIGGVLVHSAFAAGPGNGTPTTTSTTTPANQPTGRPGKGPGHGPKAVLTVSSISGEDIIAKQADGTSVTIIATSSTQYTRAGSSSSLSAISTGTHIHVQGTRNSNGSITAARIDIVLPGYHGIITAINSNSITVKDRSGSHTIEVSSSTKFVNDSTRQSIALSDLKTGENIHAEGTLNNDGSLSALVVHLGPAHPAGHPARPAPGGKHSANGTLPTPPNGTPNQSGTAPAPANGSSNSNSMATPTLPSQS
jgi:hypothetical protein